MDEQKNKPLQEHQDLYNGLEYALRRYRSKQGVSTASGMYKQMIENRINSSIDSITVLMSYFEENKEFTEEKIQLAKKMIKNAGQLT